MLKNLVNSLIESIGGVPKVARGLDKIRQETEEATTKITLDCAFISDPVRDSEFKDMNFDFLQGLLVIEIELER